MPCLTINLGNKRVFRCFDTVGNPPLVEYRLSLFLSVTKDDGSTKIGFPNSVKPVREPVLFVNQRSPGQSQGLYRIKAHHETFEKRLRNVS
jgi:hypothetical protein